MNEPVVAGPMIATLASGVVVLAIGRWPRLQRWGSVVGALAYAAAVAALAWTVVDGGALTYQVGGWDAPFGITLVADALAAFMLAITAVVAVYAAVFSVLFIKPANQRTYYHPLLQFLLLGATGALDRKSVV